MDAVLPTAIGQFSGVCVGSGVTLRRRSSLSPAPSIAKVII